MTREEIIRNLKYTMEKHKNDRVNTFDTNISVMCKDILDYLEQEPTSEMVHVETLRQVMWERDVAIEQLHELGYELGQKIEPCDDAISREWLMRKATERFYITNYFNHISAMIEEAPPVTQKSGKWIPVSERLPEDKTYVLTTIKVPNRIAHTRSGWYEGGFFHNDNGDTWKATDMEVKAWMPLPKPYEPQESEDKG